MQKKTFIFFIILFLLPKTHSWAGLENYKFALGTYASGIKLIGGQRDASIINYSSGIQFNMHLHPSFSGGLSLGIGWLRPRDPNSYFTHSGEPYRTYVYPVSFELAWKIFPENRFSPYIGTGIGVFFWDLRDISGGEKWFPHPPSGQSVYGRQSNYSGLALAGIRIHLLKSIHLNCEIRYTHLFSQNLDNIGTGDANSGMAEFKIALQYHLGRRKKSVIKPREKMMTEETFIADESPPIKIQPEDTLFIPGRSDDLEDIFERKIKQPAELPKKADPVVTVEEPGHADKDIPLFLENVQFEIASADLTNESRIILHKIAASLIANPEAHIEIRGYTDNTGDIAENLSISQRRAETVRDYLVQKGVAFHRIRAIGYGQSNPAATNKTAEGRAKNRRIEFILIE